ncbi:MAG: hypothetical protein AAF268_08145 [Cyanobacteria bacterium P01_A01_bin.3]
MDKALKGGLTSLVCAIVSIGMFFAIVFATSKCWMSIGLIAMLNASFMVWRIASNSWKYAVGFTITYAVLGIGLPVMGGIKSFILASVWGTIFLCTFSALVVVLAIGLIKRFISQAFRRQG